MNSLFDLIGSESTIHYAVLNPHDNTLYDISDSLQNITGAKDYQNKMLREVIGCLDTSDCANSAVRLDMTNKDKIIHVFECKALKKQLFVIKFKTVIDGKDKHVVLFTDTDNTSLNTKLMNDLDSIITHELRNTLNHLSLINNCLLERFSGNELDDFQELLSLSEQNVMVIDKIISIYGDIKNNIP
ncbi:hypothetical protein ACMC5R_08515 [Deferribacteres bacterium DY0037]|uniref:hypothetical protein n=1 Tax=Denitrovibrio acetiphilus TaxID=118000 RepID=UPI0003256A2D|nr:hypothetical protein [Denitrovibrio acetiphilus]